MPPIRRSHVAVARTLTSFSLRVFTYSLFQSEKLQRHSRKPLCQHLSVEEKCSRIAIILIFDVHSVSLKYRCRFRSLRSLDHQRVRVDRKMESAGLGDFGGMPLSIDNCIDNNFSFPSNDDDNVTVVATTNQSVGGGGLSLQEICDILLSSPVRPTHDPRRNARQMLNYLLMGVAGMTVGCFGLIGNLLSAIVLTRRTMTTSTYCYLAALAVCDFLVVACTLVLLIKVGQNSSYLGIWWLGHRTCDQAVVVSIPGQAAIKLPRSTQPSVPPG